VPTSLPIYLGWSIAAETAGAAVGATTVMPAVTGAPLVKQVELAAPVAGEVVALSQVPDQVFASGAVGDGVAIIPSDGHVYAPCDGVATVLMEDSRHAIGLVSDDGIEILIHVGLDTVGLNGVPFTYHVKANQAVKKGDLLITAALDAIKAAGLELHTPVLVTNANDYVSVEPTTAKTVSVGDTLITVA